MPPLPLHYRERGMAVSNVSICNMALARIEAKAQIQSLTQAGREAKFCNTFFEHCRDMLLQRMQPSWAMKRAALSDLGSPPDEWSYRYAYPSDCLLAVEIVNLADRNKRIKFEIADNDGASSVILTDEDDAVLWYVRTITNPSVFDPLFIDALAWSLAAEIAMPLTADGDRKKLAEQKMVAAIMSAAASSGNEGRIEATDVLPSWLTDR